MSSQLKRKHDDVEFHATKRGSDDTEICSTFEEAKAYLGDDPGVIDVCIWSEEGAHWYGGDDAVTQYQEDPEASVFERWIRREPGGLFECQGRIP